MPTLNGVEVQAAPDAKLDDRSICTVISLVPFEINEFKPGLIPGQFHIDAAADGNMKLLYVGDCIHYVRLDEDRGSLTVETPAAKIAESIVEDYKRALICVSPEAHPALWWEHGLLSVPKLLTTKSQAIKENREAQKLWYLALIAEADDSWTRSHQHAMISDMARSACDELGLTRDWNIVIPPDVTPLEMGKCPACGNIYFVGAVVCTHCRLILDKEKYKEFSFAE